MILADTLQTLTTFSAAALTRAIQDAGYPEDEFLAATFLGITTGGQFCYQVQYNGGDQGLLTGKVFLTYHAAGPLHGSFVKADY